MDFEITNIIFWSILFLFGFIKLVKIYSVKENKAEKEWNKLEEEYIRQNWKDFH